MAGIVYIPWYVTVFRAEKFEAAVAEIASVALRYGATDYAVHRNRDDRYKFLQMATFDTKEQWDRYWDGPEFRHFRIVTMSWYQVPVIYTWNDLVVEGHLAGNGERAFEAAPPDAVGDQV
jgi:hypothetical protein